MRCAKTDRFIKQDLYGSKHRIGYTKEKRRLMSHPATAPAQNFALKEEVVGPKDLFESCV